MDTLTIQPTSKTPKVLLDPDKRELWVEGRSRPENVREFYQPIIQSLSKSLEQLLSKDTENDTFHIHFRMEYFNSASAKYIADIMQMIIDYSDKGVSITVHWHYHPEDEDMKEAGEEFSEMMEYPFNFIEE